MPSVTFGSVHPSDVLDMPVDPNEPTYCLCHQVSYGEMIGCDNPDVRTVCLRVGGGAWRGMRAEIRRGGDSTGERDCRREQWLDWAALGLAGSLQKAGVNGLLSGVCRWLPSPPPCSGS